MPTTGVLPSTDGPSDAPRTLLVKPRRITVAELEAAINRARAAQPASGAESSLTLEVATLGALYGRLIWERREAVEIDALTDGERVALGLWLPPA
ncbi:MAG: DUF3717 domain-containing protein [Burkholderiales bacterium]|nr:MAG: DUF3717 domain-containing protein [Burkholderiales bacterium]